MKTRTLNKHTHTHHISNNTAIKQIDKQTKKKRKNTFSNNLFHM